MIHAVAKRMQRYYLVNLYLQVYIHFIFHFYITYDQLLVTRSHTLSVHVYGV